MTTWREALDLVVARTGHDRYRPLCSDANPDAEQREAYRRHVLTLAGQPPPPAPPPPVPTREAIAATRLGYRRCLYATAEGCGCAGTRCHHLGRLVTLRDCVTCLGGRP